MKLAIAALPDALHEGNFVPITLLSDGECAIALCTDNMRSLEVRFSPAGPTQHVLTTERGTRTSKFKASGILNALPYNLPMVWLMYLVHFVVTRGNVLSYETDYRAA